ncbi:hypothetical protein CCR85_01170 [Rhodothalassium salexigens]|uniref:DUF1376 domain-containing protein n=1 Tax=Rhodothalassium salexigens TaxID=1086 RepID=UPI001911916B|nr:DUF1376 domain-containing protein [Rhodothalassium salexigens]MBK5910103.1 hypothetical protein [Rhodothalassium salexigens]MBK5920716.1 hypothetical protein [Rhodothalassium salexigens]
MAEYPSMPLWTGAYLADTQDLSAEEHGVYLLLLMTAWRSERCALPDDDVRLARMVRAGTKKWAKLRAAVLERFFTLGDHGWTQKRLLAERERIDTLRAQKRKAAQAKHLKNKQSDPAAAGRPQVRNRCNPYPYPKEDSPSLRSGEGAPPPAAAGVDPTAGADQPPPPPTSPPPDVAEPSAAGASQSAPPGSTAGHGGQVVPFEAGIAAGTGSGTRSADPPPVAEAVRRWNALADELGLPRCAKVNKSRGQAIKARLREHGLPGWNAMLMAVRASPFLRGDRPGRDGRGFRANIDFVAREGSFTRILEGVYSDDTGSTAGLGQAPTAATHRPGARRAGRGVSDATVDAAAAYVRELDARGWH